MSLRKELKEIEQELKDEVSVLRKIEHTLQSNQPQERLTPLGISFKESSMLSAVAGNTLVYTGVLTPVDSVYPVGTTVTVTSSDPSVLPTVDATGLIVTVPLPSTFVENPTTPLTIGYNTSTFVPNPATSLSSISASIIPSTPAPTVLTPTGITFTQTT
jgi:hypothetical protein